MLNYNEIRERKYIVLDGEPYECIGSHIFRKQQRKPVNQTKLKNLINGKVVERSFHQSEKAKEADLETKSIKYLYNNRGEFWFSEENDPSARFKLEHAILGGKEKYLRENSIVEGLVFENKIIGLKMPLKVELKVTQAPPSFKGNTAQGGTKQITLETGATLNVPMFIMEGDIIRVNTDDNLYTERVEKG